LRHSRLEGKLRLRFSVQSLQSVGARFSASHSNRRPRQPIYPERPPAQNGRPLTRTLCKTKVCATRPRYTSPENTSVIFSPQPSCAQIPFRLAPRATRHPHGMVSLCLLLLRDEFAGFFCS
jgi:hypothetical protein